MVSLDIQGLSEEGVESFIHSYVDARQFSDNDSRLYAVTNGKNKILLFLFLFINEIDRSFVLLIKLLSFT